jgi:RNA polymerase sigma factor (sigma-70 family)
MTDLLESIGAHKPLALRVARAFFRRLPPNVQLCDLEQAALIGVFEWKRSHPDESVVGWKSGLYFRIRGAILDELRRQDWLPRRERERAKASDEHRVRVVGLDDVAPWWDDEWAGRAESPEDVLERKQEVARALATPMSERDAEVVHRVYFRGQTSKQVSEQFGCSGPRITQRHLRALDVMRAHLAEDAEGDRAVPIHSTLPDEGIDLPAELARYQWWMVDQALIRTGGNKNRAAKLLGLNRTTLVEMLKRRSQNPGGKATAHR